MQSFAPKRVWLSTSAKRTAALVSAAVRTRLGATLALDNDNDVTDYVQVDVCSRLHVRRLVALCRELEKQTSDNIFPRLYTQSLDLSSPSSSESSYRRIASDLLGGETKWSCVVALVAFTGYAAERVVQEDGEQPGLQENLIFWLQDVLATTHLSWIEEHGDWVSDKSDDAKLCSHRNKMYFSIVFI